MQCLSALALMCVAILLVQQAAADSRGEQTVRTGGEMSLAAEQNTATMLAVTLSGALDATERKIQERTRRLHELQEQVRNLQTIRIEVRCCQ